MLLVLCASFPSWAADTYFDAYNRSTDIQDSILYQAFVWEGEHADASAEQVLKAYRANSKLPSSQWRSASVIRPSILKQRTLWFVIPLPADADKRMQALEIGNNQLRRADLYIAGDDLQLDYIDSFGSQFARRGNSINHRHYIVPFQAFSGGNAVLLMRVEGQLFETLKRGFVRDIQDYYFYDSRADRNFWVYAGCIMLVGLMSVLAFWVTRDLSHIHFIGFLYSVLFIQLYYGGPILTLPGGFYGYPMERLFYVTQLLLPVSLGCFASLFLNLKNTLPVLYRLHAVVLRLLLVFIFFALWIPFDYLALLAVTGLVLGVLVQLPIWLCSFWLWSRGDHEAKNFAISWSLFWIFHVVILSTRSQLPIDPVWSASLMQFSHVVVAISLFIGVLARFNVLREEKERALLEGQAKGQFLATMSHELRTPLNGVIGMAELLSETKQTEEQRQYSEIIMSSGRVLLNLINDILDVTKVADGKLVFEEKPFELDRMLSECSFSFLNKMLEKKLPLYTVIDEKTPLMLVGDEYRIRQLLFNLFSNAMKFTDSGFIKLSVSSRSLQQDWIELRLVVEDTGLGIDENILPTIFDHFTQADVSTTRRFGGSGLGLSITKNIVEQMGGAITVKSQVGQGSEFTLQLPLQIDGPREQKRIESLQVLQDKRLLFVTDYPVLFNTLSPHFTQWGMKIELVSSLQEATQDINYYDFLAAYYIDSTISIEPLIASGLPVCLFCHGRNTELPTKGKARFVRVAVPAPVQKIANELVYLQSHSQDAEVEEHTTGVDAGLRVLVVDDNPTNLLVVVGMLKRYGIQPDQAENGKVAVEKTKQTDYDLILMDCEMPVMDGFEASQKIVTSSPTHPVIYALTAHVMGEIDMRCKEAGMMGLLHKPITREKLEEVLLEHSQQHNY